MNDAIDRRRRVAQVIQRELSALIASEVDDPDVGPVTLTSVQVSRDLRRATVYVSNLSGDEAEAKRSVKALNHASGFLRRLLAQRMTQKVTAALVFEYDHTINRGMHLSKLIDDAVGDDQVQQGEDNPQ